MIKALSIAVSTIVILFGGVTVIHFQEDLKSEASYLMNGTSKTPLAAAASEQEARVLID